MHLLQVAKNLFAQVEHNLLAGPLHQVGLYKFHDVAEQQRAKINGGNLSDASVGVGAEIAAEPRMIRLAGVGHVPIHGDHRQVRPHHVGKGFQRDGDE